LCITLQIIGLGVSFICRCKRRGISVKSRWLALILGSAVSLSALAQSPAKPLITQNIDETARVALDGTVHPLAQPGDDQGAVPDSFPAQRILLLLNRPADREAALESFLVDLHRHDSASYHQWLTPHQFGDSFGPADSDVQTATAWLTSHGLRVSRVTGSKQFIEFSGTAGQIRDAFHTEIHQFNVQGATHYANASEVSVPAALAPLVRGVSPLNNFRAKPHVQIAGTAQYFPSTKKTIPQWTMPNPFGTTNPYAYAVAPQDFVTQYDLAPLYQALINGGGQTIGIIDDSNIDISLVSAYQLLFKLTSNLPQVVIDGGDPGTLISTGSEVESYLDVELAGAIAPSATVNLYIADGSDLEDPIILAATRAVEDNQASVLSISWGECEWFLGNAGNQLWDGLWQQAAAQGQTVLVSAGDDGSQCEYGFTGVSGIASTPWNVAVGGTDFYYSDYATGGASVPTYWNQTNTTSLGSLKAPLTEQAWNDPYGLDVISNGLQRNEIYAGGGGPSACSTGTGYPNPCISGYIKPSWQTGPGVPVDGVRDLPDVSLFASNGANLSAWAICGYEGECTPGTDSSVGILLTGGTSASAPAMAGIMALVNQKYGRQGQANYTLYRLAQQQPAAFHDITLGSNMVYGTTVYSAGTGYDLATGLGSVDAAVLVNDWGSVTDQPTNTTLSLSAPSITHGTVVTATASVAPTLGTGSPIGNIAILTNSVLPASQAQGNYPLIGGRASGNLSSLPGGTYKVSADYAGDGSFGPSTSPPVSLTVSPENSNINFSMSYEGQALTYNQTKPIYGGTFQYNQPLSMDIQPIGVNALAGKPDGNATGSATFTVDSVASTVPLNSAGVANWNVPALAIGNHTATVAYSGDSSFNASGSQPITFTIGKGYPYMTDTIDTPSAVSNANYYYYIDLNPGSSLTATVEVGPEYGNQFGRFAPAGTAAPTGTVTFCMGLSQGPCGGPIYSQTATLSAPSGANAQYATASATFPSLAAGWYVFTAVYNGDANWNASGLADFTEINVQPIVQTAAASTTTVSITPTAFTGSQQATLSTTVAGSSPSGAAPTGWVYYYNDGILLTYAEVIPAKSGPGSSVSFNVEPSWFWNSGSNQLTAVYQGDSNYAPSTSSVLTFTSAQTGGGGDFTLTPSMPQIAVPGGTSGSVNLNLASLNNFNGVVTVTCVSASTNLNCAVNPSAATLPETATLTLTLQPVALAAALHPLFPNHPGLLGTSGLALASIFLCGIGMRRRRLASLLSLSVIAMLFAAGGCGGGAGGGSNNQPGSPQYVSGVYTVVVNATSGGILHNAKITVVIP
jgi:hypothetical protein